MSAGRDGDAERDRLLALLDAASARRRTVSVWWRDDDAQDLTQDLQRLLGLAAAHSLPLGLAVIPQGASADLAGAVAAAPRAAVLQHGWRHARHNRQGEKKAELGDHRPVADVLAELAEGRAILSTLFGDRFLPVLVPPWNRIADAVRERRHEAGLTGLSAFGPARRDDPHVVNAHLDLIDWTARRALPRARAYAGLYAEIERRLAGDPEPIGLLTHHLVHDGQAWALLDELLELLARHPAVRWPEVDELFDLRRERREP